MSRTYIQVLIDGPLAGSFVYACPEHIEPPRNQWVTVPWGKGRRTGLSLGSCAEDALPADLPADSIRMLDAVRDDLPALPADWLAFLNFVARYYHGKLADLALGCLPKPLRTPPSERSRTDARKRLAAFFHGPPSAAGLDHLQPSPVATGAMAANRTLDLDEVGTPVRIAVSDPGSPCRTPVPTHTATTPVVHPLERPGSVSSASPDLLDEAAPIGTLQSATAPIRLNHDQKAVLQALIEDAENPPRPWLLHGITGSGKTEVYLHWMAHLLNCDERAQVLLMVPEISLTPAVLNQLQQRFPTESIAILHSEMTDATRASHWLAAATGSARIVLGTRLASLTPLPHLAAIILDEEHDPSYKQQEGLRYSARDMAVVRAKQAAIPILMGSATPALESWHNAHSGRYRLMSMRQRASRQGALPRIRTVPLRGAKLQEGLSAEAIQAIQQTLARQEQALIFLNRRGYAPVLGCNTCGWLSHCDRCDAYRVLHRQSEAGISGPRRYQLICHHCGTCRPVPRACPDCGNQDLAPLGRGTQKLEDALCNLFPGARIGRLDRDVARKRGATQAFLAAAHAGKTDLLIGTQMLTKGHDFDRLTLVVVVDADAGLFTADFRAPERLFATLMQVAGRAGRHRSEHAQTLIQTRHPDHPLFEALRRHDYPYFADGQLAERKAGALPPYGYQALLQVQARDMDRALAFLTDVREYLLSLESPHDLHPSTNGPGIGFGSEPGFGFGSEHGDASVSGASETKDPPSSMSTGAASAPKPGWRAGAGTDDGSGAVNADTGGAGAQISVCDPVPMPLAQINKVCRAQLLIESNHRQRLHGLLHELRTWLERPHPGGARNRYSRVRWQMIVDPQEI
ncbi:MAG: primosomal protein N' [Lautropia sp.]|nr:primosomal protein N' [Lautropia sp.]